MFRFTWQPTNGPIAMSANIAMSDDASVIARAAMIGGMNQKDPGFLALSYDLGSTWKLVRPPIDGLNLTGW